MRIQCMVWGFGSSRNTISTAFSAFERSFTQSHGKCVRDEHTPHSFVRSSSFPFAIVFVFQDGARRLAKLSMYLYNETKRNKSETNKTNLMHARDTTELKLKILYLYLFVSAIKIDYPPLAPSHRFSSCKLYGRWKFDIIHFGQFHIMYIILNFYHFIRCKNFIKVAHVFVLYSIGHNVSHQSIHSCCGCRYPSAFWRKSWKIMLKIISCCFLMYFNEQVQIN